MLDRLPEASRDIARSRLIPYTTDEDGADCKVVIPLGSRGRATVTPSPSICLPEGYDLAAAGR